LCRYNAVESAKAFMRDLVDGYFPYEMKDSHPNGRGLQSSTL
jgi:hypothetical protein